MKRTTTRPAWMDAAIDERARFNAALAKGAHVTINTFCGEYVVTSVTEDFMYTSYRVDSRPVGAYNVGSRSWAGGNDGQWAQMLKQAGVPRNALWANR